MKKDEVIRLNEEQQKAVKRVDKPLLVIAGAGTGKTSVIVEKIKYLIAAKKARPESILALTFTEKAAAEMETRVDRALPYGYFQTWISTFHSFADKVLRAEGHHIGIPNQYTLMTEAESVVFFKKNLFVFDLEYFRPLGNPNKFVEAMLGHFSRLKDEDISPDEYEKWAKKIKKTDMTPEERKKYKELAFTYQTYQHIKLRERVLDFSDLVYYLLVLFRKRPHILKSYQERFPYGLVDEFQDTNMAQYSLIKLLFPPAAKPCLTVVGDDSQAIYKFRGASVSNILQFMHDYPGADRITLIENYRSTQSILDHAHQLIVHNNPDTLEYRLSISKKLKSKKSDHHESVHFTETESVEQEADFVASTIENLVHKRPFSDFAILVRANNTGIPFIRALTQRGIPARFLGPSFLFKQPEVKDLIAYLKVLSNLDDSTALYRVLSMDILQLNMMDVHAILAFSRKTGLSLFQALKIYASKDAGDTNEEYTQYHKHLPQTNKKTGKEIHKFLTMLERHIGLIKKETAGQILFYFLEDTGYLKKMTSYSTAADEKRAQTISRFFSRLKAYEYEHEDATVFTVVDFIDMSMELGESPLLMKDDEGDVNAVNILTIHSSKGLEFPIVFIPQANAGKFPTIERREALPIPDRLIKEQLPEGNPHLQEERRLFYVALTRAKEQAYITASRFSGEGKRQRKISPFVFEVMGDEYMQRHELRTVDERAQLSIFDYRKKPEIQSEVKTELSPLSYSQLETYTTCPLQYKYRYVLGLPSSPSQAASFGSSIHNALERFYKEYVTNYNIGVKRLIELYRESWIPIGYSSLAHQLKRKKEGEKLLRAYFKKFHSTNLTVQALEQIFKVKLNTVTIRGKIDRIDRLPSGEMEIIDYKTGKKPSDTELRNSMQLSIYALAASDKSLFNMPLGKISLTFYFLQDMLKVTLKRTPEQLNKTFEKIEEVADQIRHGHFEPKVGKWCDFCSFRMICEAWQ